MYALFLMTIEVVPAASHPSRIIEGERSALRIGTCWMFELWRLSSPHMALVDDAIARRFSRVVGSRN